MSSFDSGKSILRFWTFDLFRFGPRVSKIMSFDWELEVNKVLSFDWELEVSKATFLVISFV